jgi:simple sugar transport system ATP-binding protein
VTPILRLRGITKRFGAVVANDGISLDLAAGEVLALLGENGAGKSTLVSILFGHYVADEGSIEVFGRPLPPGQPRAALDSGIGMVHQHFTLADNLSVLDNVMLGTEPLWRPVSRRAAGRQRLLTAARDFGLAVDPDARVADLSVGERQRVEILKALVRGARILILDEPTAVLTPQESESLFATLAQMVAQGLGIIFISHKLDEVLRVSDRVAVLRGGRLVAELPAAGARKEDLAEAMVGRAVAPAMRRAGGGASAAHLEGGDAATQATAVSEAGDAPALASSSGLSTAAPRAPSAPPVCELRTATVRGHGPWPLLDAVDLSVSAGEVVAVAGVAGNGQAALAEVLFGQRPLDAGQALLRGRPLPARPGDAVRAGIARIPEDRHAVGVVGDLPLWENAILERYATPAFSRFGFARRDAAQAHARGIVQRFDVRGTEGGGLDTVTRGLSGGNMQKLILGRALTPGPGEPAPRLIVASQPTWGLDVGAVAYVHQQLLDACAGGAAVLLISEDLDEIFALADRIAVMHHGRLTSARPTPQWTLASIGLAMAGGAPGVVEGSPPDGPRVPWLAGARLALPSSAGHP